MTGRASKKRSCYWIAILRPKTQKVDRAEKVVF